jgi:hypothetical protein
VSRQIIDDDDVAGRQRRDQAVLDISTEDRAVIARSMTKGAVTASTLFLKLIPGRSKNRQIELTATRTPAR